MTISYLVLEDDKRRRDEMLRVCAGDVLIIFGRTATEMITLIAENHLSASAISLDHDLDYLEPGVDPGDGRDVVKWLCANIVKLPILIHASNSVMGDSMWYNLLDAGYRIDRIDPYDDLMWIGKSWKNKMGKLCI